MNKSIFVIPIVAILFLTTISASNVRAETAFDEGWHIGESDYKSGDSKNPRCSSDIEAGVCASYRAGYEAGWFSASLLWPEDRQEALN